MTIEEYKSLKSKRSKYRNKKVTANGVTYDSTKEKLRHDELLLLERARVITELQRQVKFELVPKQDGLRAVTYIADFVYTENGKRIVEDVKGYHTDVYKIKKKLMLHMHGIRIRET